MNDKVPSGGLESIVQNAKEFYEDFIEEYLGVSKLLGYTGIYNILGTYHPSVVDNFSKSMLGTIARIPVVLTELLFYVPKILSSAVYNQFANDKLSTFKLDYLHNSDVAGQSLQSAVHMLGASDATTHQVTQWLQDSHINPENLVAGAVMICIATLWNQKIYKYACPVHKHGVVTAQKNVEGITYNGRA